MDIGEALNREREAFDRGLAFGVVGVLWAELLLGGVIFLVATILRAWL